MHRRPLVDQAARDRFRTEWNANFAVSANAGSGKTTAISQRLAALALSPEGAERLRRTVVVTYTKKAAAEIEQRARQELLRALAAAGRRDLAPLDHLERAFFGTIHSFCLRLAQLYGQTVGINLNPTVVAEDDAALWEEFVEQDPMEFASLGAAELAAFLRHVPLESIFELAANLDAGTAAQLLARRLADPLHFAVQPALDHVIEHKQLDRNGRHRRENDDHEHPHQDRRAQENRRLAALDVRGHHEALKNDDDAGNEKRE